MFKNLSQEQLEAILDALPIEFIFIDENERLIYANKGKKRSRPASEDVIGKDIRGCHKPQSIPKVEEFISNLKSGKKDEESFWILFPGQKILNRFIAVRDKTDKYLGTIEYLLDFKTIQDLAEDKKNEHALDYTATKPSENP